MSNPLNHHYVSQCQIRNFFNKEAGKIFLYDKIQHNHFNSTSTKKIFSERHLNSRSKDGIIDTFSLEADLNSSVESSFTKNFNILLEAVTTEIIPPDIKDVVIGLLKYGIAGEIRTPKHKKDTDESIKNAFDILLDNAIPELKQSLDGAFANLRLTPYSNLLEYSDFVETVFESIGDINFILYVINSDQFFLLPDRPSSTRRERINNHYNPDAKEIAVVQVPLSSKMFLHCESVKFRKFKSRFVELSDLNQTVIDDINKNLYFNANQLVACENEQYLTSLIKKFN